MGAVAGSVGVASFQALFIASMLLHPEWRLGQDFMSELGVAETRSWLFNSSVMLMGALGAVFALTLQRVLGEGHLSKLSVALLFLGCACLFSLGVFTMDQRAVHDLLAWGFFLSTVLALMIMLIPLYLKGRGAERLLAATFATASFSVANYVLLLIRLIKQHLAEVLVVYALGAWILVVSAFLYMEHRRTSSKLTPGSDSRCCSCPRG